MTSRGVVMTSRAVAMTSRAVVITSCGVRRFQILCPTFLFPSNSVNNYKILTFADTNFFVS